MTPELKAALDESTKTIAQLREKVESLEGKTADVLDQATLDKAKTELSEKLDAEQKARDDLSGRLEALENASNRPGAAGGEEKEDKHAQLFDGFMRKGHEPDELKAMATTSETDGGVLIPNSMRAGIQERLRRGSPIRQYASVVTIEGNSYGVLVERGDAGYEWAGETQSRSETGTPTINRISIDTHELSAMPKISQRMLDDAEFDVAAFVISRVTDRFARAENASFVLGDGANKPKGFLTYGVEAKEDADRAAEKLQVRKTGANGSFAAQKSANVLVKSFYDLQSAYQANATWMMRNTTAAEVATLQDDNGQYLLQEMLNADGNLVRTIQGRPVAIADDMPKIGNGSLSIALGDFSAGYTIVDGRAITVLRDPFSAKPNVLFYTTKRVGGGVTDFDAIKLIQFSS